MTLFSYLAVGVLLAWPVHRLLHRLLRGQRKRMAWMRRLPGFQPRHLRVYAPRPRPQESGDARA